MANERKSKRSRSTGETTISIEINLDGKGTSNIESPIGMLNHMLDQKIEVHKIPAQNDIQVKDRATQKVLILFLET